MSSSEIAAKEAFEPGVIGYISPNLGGMFRARKYKWFASPDFDV